MFSYLFQNCWIGTTQFIIWASVWNVKYVISGPNPRSIYRITKLRSIRMVSRALTMLRSSNVSSVITHLSPRSVTTAIISRNWHNGWALTWTFCPDHFDRHIIPFTMTDTRSFYLDRHMIPFSFYLDRHKIPFSFYFDRHMIPFSFYLDRHKTPFSLTDTISFYLDTQDPFTFYLDTQYPFTFYLDRHKTLLPWHTQDPFTFYLDRHKILLPWHTRSLLPWQTQDPLPFTLTDIRSVYLLPWQTQDPFTLTDTTSLYLDRHNILFTFYLEKQMSLLHWKTQYPLMRGLNATKKFMGDRWSPWDTPFLKGR